MGQRTLQLVMLGVVVLNLIACSQSTSLVRENVKVRGDVAVLTLAAEQTLAGELIFREHDSLWLSAADGHLYAVPIQDIAEVEIFDTKVSAYLAPTLITFVGSWTLIGVAGSSYTGDAGFLSLSLYGLVLSLVPIIANEVGMRNPHFDLLDIRMGEMQQYARYPFSPIPTDIRSHILQQHKQTGPLQFKPPPPAPEPE